jgi:phospholipase C
VAASAVAQTSPPAFSHIVIIVQENRTPDNLFGANPSGTNCRQENPFEPGIDIVDGGPNKWSLLTGWSCSVKNSGLLIGGSDHCHTCKDPGHPLLENTGWVPQCDYDSSKQICKMDGASHSWENPNNNPEYEYVDKAAVQPYFDIATYYGFANYMFMTHEGPSFDAHQFIFGGSSAPVFPGNEPYDQWFVAENEPNTHNIQGIGCPATGSIGWPMWVDPDGNEWNDFNSSECYDRNTLVTYQDSSGNVHDWTLAWQNIPQPAWKYYMPADSSAGNAAIWNGPADDPQTCYFTSTRYGVGQACGSNNSTEYSTHVIAGGQLENASAPILSDIQNCQLPAISWVITRRTLVGPPQFILGQRPRARLGGVHRQRHREQLSEQ